MKRTDTASLLNFALPGAGLCYLGKWKWGFFNFAIVLLVGILSFILLGDSFSEYIRYIAYGCAGGSGGFALFIAKKLPPRTPCG